MVSILGDYFGWLDSEVFFWLRVLVILPFAFVFHIAAGIKRRLRAVRFRAGALLIGLALWLFPSCSTIRVELMILMKDLAGFRRYSGWCECIGARRLPFRSWRAEREWILSKMRRMVADGR